MSLENNETTQEPSLVDKFKNSRPAKIAASIALLALGAFGISNFLGSDNESKAAGKTTAKLEPAAPVEQPQVPVRAKPEGVSIKVEAKEFVKPDRPSFDLPPLSAIPLKYEELPKMSFKPSADEILAFADTYAPELPPLELSIAFERIESQNIRVSAQATKDVGYFYANGKAGLPESDAMANSFYEASLQNSEGENIQAAHDLGYHLLHGKGVEQDYDRARDLLTQAHEGGHPLSEDMLIYMDERKLGLN